MRYVLPALVALVVVTGMALAERIDTPPRLLAPWIERRVEGQGRLIERIGADVAAALLALDRPGEALHDPLPVPPLAAPATSKPGRDVVVGSTAEALRAIDD